MSAASQRCGAAGADLRVALGEVVPPVVVESTARTRGGAVLVGCGCRCGAVEGQAEVRLEGGGVGVGDIGTSVSALPVVRTVPPSTAMSLAKCRTISFQLAGWRRGDADLAVSADLLAGEREHAGVISIDPESVIEPSTSATLSVPAWCRVGARSSSRLRDVGRGRKRRCRGCGSSVRVIRAEAAVWSWCRADDHAGASRRRRRSQRCSRG